MVLHGAVVGLEEAVDTLSLLFLGLLEYAFDAAAAVIVFEALICQLVCILLESGKDAVLN